MQTITKEELSLIVGGSTTTNSFYYAQQLSLGVVMLTSVLCYAGGVYYLYGKLVSSVIPEDKSKEYSRA